MNVMNHERIMKTLIGHHNLYIRYSFNYYFFGYRFSFNIIDAIHITFFSLYEKDLRYEKYLLGHKYLGTKSRHTYKIEKR